MEKKSFKYRNNKIAMIWIVTMGIVLVWFIPEILNSLNGIMYYLINAILTISLVFLLWRCVNIFPGVSKVGYFWKENGVTIIEYSGKSVGLNHVTELYLSEKNSFVQGVFLKIENDGKKIVFLSEPIGKKKSVEDLTIFTLFLHVLADNHVMAQEKDVHGNPIKYWYKVQH